MSNPNQPSSTIASEEKIESLLPPGKALFSTAAMERLTGVPLECWKRWRRERTAGSPNYIKVGRSVRYPRPDVIAWLLANYHVMPAALTQN